MVIYCEKYVEACIKHTRPAHVRLRTENWLYTVVLQKAKKSHDVNSFPEAYWKNSIFLDGTEWLAGHLELWSLFCAITRCLYMVVCF